MSAGGVLPRVAVVVVNYRRPEDTIACLQSIRGSIGVHPEVIFVDNGSEDGSTEKVRSAYPDILLLALPHNLGFAGGYNAGIARALETDADFIFLLNNDTTLDPDCMRALVHEQVASGWDVGVPKILYYSQPDRIWAAGCRWRSFPPSVVIMGLDRRDGPEFNQPRRLEYATGCALMLQRRVLEALPGFDRDLENYMEDYDFCYRLRRAGYSIGYVPQARLWHKVSQTLGIYSPERWRQQGKNTVLFYRKGDRFSLSSLWSFLIWVTLREAVKGHLRLLPGFWTGVRQGFDRLRATDPSQGE